MHVLDCDRCETIYSMMGKLIFIILFTLYPLFAVVKAYVYFVKSKLIDCGGTGQSIEDSDSFEMQIQAMN